MNREGAKARAAGLRLCYHNHGFEFSGSSGPRPFDLLMENFDPALVSWELDVFWCNLAGFDPVELISEYPDRIPLPHLKDKAPGLRQNYNYLRSMRF